MVPSWARPAPGLGPGRGGALPARPAVLVILTGVSSAAAPTVSSSTPSRLRPAQTLLVGTMLFGFLIKTTEIGAQEEKEHKVLERERERASKTTKLRFYVFLIVVAQGASEISMYMGA